MKESTYVCSTASGVEMKIRNAKKYYNKRKPSGGPGVPASEPSKEKKPRREANGDGESRKPKGKARAAKAK